MTVLEIVLRESKRQIRLLLMNDERLDSINVLTGFFVHGSTASVDLDLLCEAPQSHWNTLTLGRNPKAE